MNQNIPVTKVLSSGEERSLDKEIGELKDIRDEIEVVQGVQHEVKNKAELNKKISDLEAIKRSQGAPELSEVDKSRAVKELGLLTEDLRKGMPEWDTYVGLTPKHGARYTALVKWISQSENDPVRRQKVARWKMLRRLVDPHDPLAGDVRYLFPQG